MWQTTDLQQLSIDGQLATLVAAIAVAILALLWCLRRVCRGAARICTPRFSVAGHSMEVKGGQPFGELATVSVEDRGHWVGQGCKVRVHAQQAFVVRDLRSARRNMCRPNVDTFSATVAHSSPPAREKMQDSYGHLYRRRQEMVERSQNAFTALRDALLFQANLCNAFGRRACGRPAEVSKLDKPASSFQFHSREPRQRKKESASRYHGGA